jgi:hypothetical protein
MGRKSGRIAKVYKTDEVSDNHAVVLECPDGNTIIPLFTKPAVKEGGTLSVISKRN